MKNPLGIFVLTKREQRVVIVIVMVLLAVTIAKRYRETRWHIAPPTSTSVPAALSPSPPEEESKVPAESP